MTEQECFKPSEILHWYSVADYGYPPRELRKFGHPYERDRVFLVKTDCGLRASTVHDDGSGFRDLGDCIEIAWAFTEND